MVSKAAKIRLGVFIVLGFSLIALFVIIISGNKLFPKQDTYYIRFRNFSVSGLQIGGAVNYRGIQVGKVEKIAIDPKDVTSVILTLSIDPGTPLKVDNEAVLVLMGITGIKSVEIRGGTNASRFLKPKSFIPSGMTKLDELSGKATSIIDKIEQIANNLNQLTAADNQKNLADILAQTSALLSETRIQLSATLESISNIANATSGVTDNLSLNLTEITRNMTHNIDSLSTATVRNIDRIGSETVNDIDSLTVVTRGSLERLTSTLTTQIDQISTNLNTLVLDLNDQSRQILAETRFTLGSIGTHSDSLITSTTREIAGLSIKINQSLDRVNYILNSAEIDNLVANLNTLTAQLNEANVKGLVEELSLTVNKAGNLVNNIDRTLIRNRTNLNDIIESLREASENLNEFSRQIADQPLNLFRGN